MGGFLDAITEIIDSHGEYGADIGALIDDPWGYFGLDIFTPEGSLDTVLDYVATGELPEFPNEVLGFINDPTVTGGLGLIPGVGTTIDTGLTVLDDVVDLPDWVAGGADASKPPSVSKPETLQHPVKCCCCCCKSS